MSVPTSWPGGARASVSITVDNLGEAAEIELGLRDPDAPMGGHHSVTSSLPLMLSQLAARDLHATFLIEGINAVIYPEALAEISAAGHEIGYHAWCHEDWSLLDAEQEVANLDRGLEAFRGIGIEPAGFRPPGGRITPATLELLQRRGLSYCSPAGSLAGIERVAVLPFAWPAVDVFHVLPAFAALRERLGVDGEAGGPEAVRGALLEAVDGALAEGGHVALVLHTWMIELELEVVRDVLSRVRRAVDAGELWIAPCCEVAAWMAGHPEDFTVPPRLDQVSWITPS